MSFYINDRFSTYRIVGPFSWENITTEYSSQSLKVCKWWGWYKLKMHKQKRKLSGIGNYFFSRRTHEFPPLKPPHTHCHYPNFSSKATTYWQIIWEYSGRETFRCKIQNCFMERKVWGGLLSFISSSISFNFSCLTSQKKLPHFSLMCLRNISVASHSLSLSFTSISLFLNCPSHACLPFS